MFERIKRIFSWFKEVRIPREYRIQHWGLGAPFWSSLGLATIIIFCTNHKDCEKNVGTVLPKGHGIVTGRCIPNDVYPQNSSCEIIGWCPVERNPGPVAFLRDSGNHTLFVQTIAKFDIGGDIFYKKNVQAVQNLKGLNNTQIEQCIYNRDDPINKYCPRFLIKDIVKYSNKGTDMEDEVSGGVYSVELHWKCDLNGEQNEDDCVPEFKFKRHDAAFNKYRSIVYGISRGYRSHFYYEDNRRTLIIKNGIKIIIEMTGEGYRFEWWRTTKSAGSYFGLLGTLWVVALHIIPRAFYCVTNTPWCARNIPWIVPNLNDDEKRDIRLAIYGREEDQIPRTTQLLQTGDKNNVIQGFECQSFGNTP